jgi:hypothetical protein
LGVGARGWVEVDAACREGLVVGVVKIAMRGEVGSFAALHRSNTVIQCEHERTNQFIT